MRFQSFPKQQVKHKLGHAIIHDGSLINQALPLESGTKVDLVLGFVRDSYFPQFPLLPKDVQQIVLSFLTPSDLCKISSCCKSLQDLSNSNLFWKPLFMIYHPSRIESILKYEEMLGSSSSKFSNWKNNFRLCHLEYLAFTYFRKCYRPAYSSMPKKNPYLDSMGSIHPNKLKAPKNPLMKSAPSGAPVSPTFVTRRRNVDEN